RTRYSGQDAATAVSAVALSVYHGRTLTVTMVLLQWSPKTSSSPSSTYFSLAHSIALLYP
ncbi:hypothetical protein HAX54_018791, partial [Datura stramonium]|nr:hypothetical protein [Datura stramonium]